MRSSARCGMKRAPVEHCGDCCAGRSEAEERHAGRLPTLLCSTRGFTVAAWIKLHRRAKNGRIFDKITARGSHDGFLLDADPGLSLRLIVGADQMTAPNCLKPGVWQHVAATFDAATGVRRIFLNGKLLKEDGDGGVPVHSRVTQAYVLQRWITACGGRGHYPIKFNGSIFTVDSKFAGEGNHTTPDWARRWGDCFWWQNTRLPYFPMIARGDYDETSHPSLVSTATSFHYAGHVRKSITPEGRLLLQKR